MIKSLLTLVCCSILSVVVYAQETTVGLLSYDITQSYQGYTLIYPHNQPSVFLLDNCGQVVHEWDDDANFRPGNTAYILSDGRLAKAKRPADISMDSIWAGGGGAIIELRSWDNDLLWSYELNSPEARLHHDFRVLPNGNILMLAWERKTNAEAIAAGRDSSKLNQIVLWPDFLQEVDPNTNEIVWEWHVWDHLVQDFDSTRANYGVVSESPHKVNLNWDTSEGASDWMHSNAIDYNPTLDHIMISVPTFHELWVIDHSTTTEQARTGRGGKSNRGGDLLYRIGNPAAYDRSDAGEQILFYQHDTHWANEFLPESHPAIKPMGRDIVLFNNRQPGGYSTVEIFEPAWNMYSGQYEPFQGSWPPYEFENTLTHPDTLGYIFELTPENKVVWEYITPIRRGEFVEQGSTLEINNNLTFRAFRYPPEYIAFQGRDLTPQQFLEVNPIQDYCDRLVSTYTPEEAFSLIYPNPVSNRVHLSWDSGKVIDITIYNLNGQLIKRTQGNGGMKYLDVAELEAGLYLIAINGVATHRMIKQ